MVIKRWMKLRPMFYWRISNLDQSYIIPPQTYLVYSTVLNGYDLLTSRKIEREKEGENKGITLDQRRPILCESMVSECTGLPNTILSSNRRLIWRETTTIPYQWVELAFHFIWFFYIFCNTILMIHFFNFVVNVLLLPKRWQLVLALLFCIRNYILNSPHFLHWEIVHKL